MLGCLRYGLMHTQAQALKNSAQEWKNRTLAPRTGRYPNLVLAGSESIFTEITEYQYISLLHVWACAELEYQKYLK